MTGQTFYGRVFSAWREASRDTWKQYTRHAFVAGIADGSLPDAAFLHYLRQDYVFLVHFSRAWGLAIAKSGTLEEMKVAAGTVDALVNHEMQLHVQTCAAAGLSEADLIATKERPANLAYTRYVLEAGYSGDFLDLMAALAPCVMGYGEIGARLAREATSDRYCGWIETYAGSNYQEACEALGRLIDASLPERLGRDFGVTPRWKSLGDRFKTATELEIGFWEMGLSP